MSWLVTGGAGYIGSHVVLNLRRAGYDVIVLDDLSTGDHGRLPADVPFYRASVLDTEVLTKLLLTQRPSGVIHLAGRKNVAESLVHPLLYYQHNVLGMHSLLTAVVTAGVHRIVLSSSAAVYGASQDGRVSETSAAQPVSPYGRTKLMCEQMLGDVGTAHGLSWVVLRYFNVAGAVEPRLADRGTENLIPRIFAAITAGTQSRIFGTTHPTADGTCVRDYVHVADVAEAHTDAIRALEARPLREVYNVGRGEGASVLQVLLGIQRSTSCSVEWQPAPPRAGEPPSVVADPTKIEAQLRWRARSDLETIISSAWRAWSTSARDSPLASASVREQTSHETMACHRVLPS